jgi:hypothetical protein
MVLAGKNAIVYGAAGAMGGAVTRAFAGACALQARRSGRDCRLPRFRCGRRDDWRDRQPHVRRHHRFDLPDPLPSECSRDRFSIGCGRLETNRELVTDNGHDAG